MFMKRFITAAGTALIILFITGCPGNEDAGSGPAARTDGRDSQTAAALFDDLPSGDELDEKQLEKYLDGQNEWDSVEDTGLPVFSAAEGDTSDSGKSSSGAAGASGSGGDSGTGADVYVYRDDFDSLDFDFWSAVEEKTKRRTDEKLRLEEGSLVIEAVETDRNPFVHSKSIPLPEKGIVQVKRRAKIHRANEYFNGTFSLYQSSMEGIKQSDNGGKEETKKIAGVQFLDFQYDIGRYPIAKGVLLTAPGYKENGEFAVFDDPPFDQWVEEEIEYNTATGKIVYRLDGESRTVMGEPAELPYFRVYMNAYGWHTGHRADVDYVEIRVSGAVPGGSGDAGIGGADVLPGGFVPREPVIAKQYVPSAEEQAFSAPDGVRVNIPPFAASGEQQLTVRPLEMNGDAVYTAAQVSPAGAGSAEGTEPGSGREILAAYEVSLGNVHRFDSFVRVEMPLPDLSDLPGETPEDKVIAVSYDPVTGSWYQELAEFKEGTITVLMKHLSVAGVRIRGNAPSSVLTDPPDSFPTENREKALDAAWSAFMNELGWTSAAGNFTTLVTEFPFLKEIHTDLGNFGNAMAVLDVAKKMVNGKTAEANISALKSVQGWLMGKLATTSMQIASVGVFFIDYSLNKFATVALGREFAAYEQAYKNYYLKYGKSPTEWYHDFKKILAGADSQEEARKKVNQLIDSYVNKIWTAGEYDRLLKFVNEAKGTSVGQISLSLTGEVEQKLSNNHKALLAQSLQPVFLTLKKELLSKVQDRQYVHQKAMEQFLKRKTVVFVDIQGLRKGEKAEAALFKEGKPIVKGRPGPGRGGTAGPSADRADFYMALPVWKLVRYGGPDAVKIRVHLKEGDERVIRVFSKSFNADEPVQKVSFNLDEVYDRGEKGSGAGEDTDKTAGGETAEDDGGRESGVGSGTDSDDADSVEYIREGIWDGHFQLHEVHPEIERKLLKSVNEAQGSNWEGDAAKFLDEEESIGYTFERNEQGDLAIRYAAAEEYDLHVEGRKFSLVIWAFGKGDRHKARMVFDGTLQGDGETIKGSLLVDCIFGEIGRGEFRLEWSELPVFDDNGEGDDDELIF
jgi:hypothetical protein